MLSTRDASDSRMSECILNAECMYHPLTPGYRQVYHVVVVHFFLILTFLTVTGDSGSVCNVACVPIDVAKLESIRSGISRAEDLAGSTIDVCINCAGIAASVPALEMDEDQARVEHRWCHAFEV